MVFGGCWTGDGRKIIKNISAKPNQFNVQTDTDNSRKHFVLFIACKKLSATVLRLPNLPLFFCVRAISFSISDIFSKIPMAAAVAFRRNSQKPNEIYAVAEKWNWKKKDEIETRICRQNVCDCRRQKPSYETSKTTRIPSREYFTSVERFSCERDSHGCHRHYYLHHKFEWWKRRMGFFKNIYISSYCPMHNIQFQILFNTICVQYFIRRRTVASCTTSCDTCSTHKYIRICSEWAGFVRYTWQWHSHSPSRVLKI